MLIESVQTREQPICRGPAGHVVPLDLHERIRGSLASNAHAHTHRYEGADHGFDRDGYPPYHPEAATLARRRTLDILCQHLRGKAS